MLIVLDKCWLQSASASEIRQLKRSYSFVLPTTFYLELISDENCANRALLAKKLGSEENSGASVFLPELLRWEIQHSKPAQPVDRFLRRDFVLNPSLSDPKFRLREEDREHLTGWESQNSVAVQQFKAQAAPISYWFPELAKFPPGGDRTAIETAMHKAARNETVLEIYTRFRSARLPPADRLDSTWILFRHTQLNLLASLEFTARYGAGANNVVAKRLYNDVLDLEYLIAATMVGAFASLDKQSRKFFKLACPAGILIPEAVRTDQPR